MLLLPLHVDIDIFLRNANKMKHVLRSLNGRNTELKLSQPKEDYDVMKKRNIIIIFLFKKYISRQSYTRYFLRKVKQRETSSEKFK